MRQIIMNLVINASEAIGDRSGAITLRTGAAHCDRAALGETYLGDELPEGLYVYVEVADNGCGMAAETRAKIFDPFFTTKFTGRGLGLAAVLGIVRGHHGAIRCTSVLGQGTTFKVLFPASPLHAKVAEGPEAAAQKWRGSGTILVVDDEETIRALARHMLMKMGFQVLTAADGREALEIFRAEGDKIRLVLLDMTMPHLDGDETFRGLQRMRPDVEVILSSGFNESTATGRFAGLGLAGFLQKPYRYEELLALVRQSLDRDA
jgi:CheY-like chemotaxis protein